jgi:hypothetical protein
MEQSVQAENDGYKYLVHLRPDTGAAVAGIWLGHVETGVLLHNKAAALTAPHLKLLIVSAVWLGGGGVRCTGLFADRDLQMYIFRHMRKCWSWCLV